MLDLDSLPIDVTGHIQKIRRLLNNSWDSIHYLMDGCNQSDIDETIVLWLEATWEVLVEGELLGRDFGLVPLALKPDSKSLINPERIPSYVILCKVNDKDIKDSMINQKPIPHHILLRVYGFLAYSLISKTYGIKSPFDIACLIDDKTSNTYFVPVEKVNFFVYPITVLDC